MKRIVIAGIVIAIAAALYADGRRRSVEIGVWRHRGARVTVSVGTNERGQKSASIHVREDPFSVLIWQVDREGIDTLQRLLDEARRELDGR